MTKTKNPVLELRKVERRRVSDRVLDALGTPHDLVRVQVRHIKDKTFRVNVWCERWSSSIVKEVFVKHSYWVSLTPDGLVSDPPILSKY